MSTAQKPSPTGPKKRKRPKSATSRKVARTENQSPSEKTEIPVHTLPEPHQAPRILRETEKDMSTEETLGTRKPTTTTFDLAAEYQTFLKDLDSLEKKPPAPRPSAPTLTRPLTTATPPPVPTPTFTRPTTGRKVKALRNNFASNTHDNSHFLPTTEKPKQGVWGTTNRTKVKKWVNDALFSIQDNDQFVVGVKKGTGTTLRYLVSMNGEEVGYLSGSSVPSGTKPPSTYLEVYLDKKGNTISAFPSDPSIF